MTLQDTFYTLGIIFMTFFIIWLLVVAGLLIYTLNKLSKMRSDQKNEQIASKDNILSSLASGFTSEFFHQINDPTIKKHRS